MNWREREGERAAEGEGDRMQVTAREGERGTEGARG